VTKGYLRHLLLSVARRLPLLREVAAERELARLAPQFVPPGHFYSPIPAISDLRRDHARLFREPTRTLPGIDLNERQQLELLAGFKSYYADLRFPEEKTSGQRYFYQNNFYSYSDAICLYFMIRHLRPARVIEVGSGFSSCVTLDTNDHFFGGDIRCTFIEPYPERLLSLLKPGDAERIEIVRERLQDVPVDHFLELQSGDILFVDSTHVAKIGSDVTYIFAEILPRLAPGVHVHFHDVFYPFEYPAAWVYGGRAWSEAYVLRAFLSYNRDFEIVLFNTFLEHFHREVFATDFPLCLRNTGGSIWIRRGSATEVSRRRADI
jgi:methyltransferase family protein